MFTKTIEKIREELSSKSIDKKGQPTHLLSCRHAFNVKSGLDYFMKCKILKKMPGQRLKIVVFGDRYWNYNKDKRYIRYVDSSRVSPIKPKLNIERGYRVSFIGDNGITRIGSLRIREIYCGKKNCHKCPHKIYAYVRYREGKKVKDKYIGVARS